jgi:hypothetical protein
LLALRVIARRRPFGVYAIAALLLLDAVALVTAASNESMARVLEFHFQVDALGHLPVLSWVGAALLVAVTLGLIALQRWAWVGTMVLIGVGLAIGIWLYFAGTPQYPNMLLNVLVVFYLNQRSVQEAFETSPRGVH